MYCEPGLILFDKGLDYFCLVRWQAVPHEHESLLSVFTLEVVQYRNDFLLARASLGEPCERGCSLRLCIQSDHTGGGHASPATS